MSTEEQNMIVARAWITGHVYQAKPYRKVKCHICAAPIVASTNVFRYITGYYKGSPSSAFICTACARNLLEAIIAEATTLLASIED